MMPETWVPTSTSVTGSTVPVAVTELLIAMRLVGAVSSVISSRFDGRSSTQSTTAARRTYAAMSMFLFFMMYASVVCLRIRSS